MPSRPSRRGRGGSLPHSWTNEEDWMGEELTLDLGLPEPTQEVAGAARRSDPPTSKVAALKNPGARANLRGRILEIFFDNRYRMHNDDELVQALDERWPTVDGGHHLPSVVKRKAELVEMGWLEPAGFSRLTRRNTPAEVFRLSTAAKADGWTEGWTDDG